MPKSVEIGFLSFDFAVGSLPEIFSASSLFSLRSLGSRLLTLILVSPRLSVSAVSVAFWLRLCLDDARLPFNYGNWRFSFGCGYAALWPLCLEGFAFS